MAARWWGCVGGRHALGALGLVRRLGRTLLVQSLASPGAKIISSRYLQLGIAPAPDADLMPSGPASSFGILFMAKRCGSCQPTSHAVLVSWDGFSRAKGSQNAPSPHLPCLPSMHRPERQEGKDVPSVTQQPGSRKLQSWSPQSDTDCSEISQELWEILPFPVIHQ